MENIYNKAEILYREIGNADDKYVEEALDDRLAQKIRRRNIRKRSAVRLTCAAAAMAVIVSAAVLLPKGDLIKQQNETSDTSVQNETAAEQTEQEEQPMGGAAADNAAPQTTEQQDAALNDGFVGEAEEYPDAEAEEASRTVVIFGEVYEYLGSLPEEMVGEGIEDSGEVEAREIEGLAAKKAAAVYENGGWSCYVNTKLSADQREEIEELIFG